MDVKEYKSRKKIGIVAHSYEGGSLCFITACREGAVLLGPHMHPNIILSAIPMGLSMPAWEADDYKAIEPWFVDGLEQVAKGGADFFICPDNTAHIVWEKIIDKLPIPGLHIADVVCYEIKVNGWKKIGLLGTKWTMTGPVYENAFAKRGLEKIIPSPSAIEEINRCIFDELCQGIFKEESVTMLVNHIHALKRSGAECVVLGCTEFPLVITPENSPLPILDSTRLLAKYAVKLSLRNGELVKKGWIDPTQ